MYLILERKDRFGYKEHYSLYYSSERKKDYVGEQKKAQIRILERLGFGKLTEVETINNANWEKIYKKKGYICNGWVAINPEVLPDNIRAYRLWRNYCKDVWTTSDEYAYTTKMAETYFQNCIADDTLMRQLLEIDAGEKTFAEISLW